MKYVLMCGGIYKNWETPKQLIQINNERIIERTIRLLKKNGIENIVITTNNPAFEGLGVPVIYYDSGFISTGKQTLQGYWLDAFDLDLLNQPVCFLFGDVYYSDDAIKKIIETTTNSTLFFCSYENKSKEYIKHHDEPLAYKVVDYQLFKKHINRVKKMKDDGLCVREPIVWELYRSINNLPINEHQMSNNYIAINDISCDIDGIEDIKNLENEIRRLEMIKCEVIKQFTFKRFDELKNIKRKSIEVKGKLLVGDEFECSKEIADYLTGNNPINEIVVKVIEVEPEAVVEQSKVKDEVVEKPKKKYYKSKKVD